MAFEQHPIETLKDELQRAENWLEHSRSLVSKQGGWIAWNGDDEERVEKYVRELLTEIRKRQAKNNVA